MTTMQVKINLNEMLEDLSPLEKKLFGQYITAKLQGINNPKEVCLSVDINNILKSLVPFELEGLKEWAIEWLLEEGFIAYRDEDELLEMVESGEYTKLRDGIIRMKENNDED